MALMEHILSTRAKSIISIIDMQSISCFNYMGRCINCRNNILSINENVFNLTSSFFPTNIDILQELLSKYSTELTETMTNYSIESILISSIKGFIWYDNSILLATENEAIDLTNKLYYSKDSEMCSIVHSKLNLLNN